MALSGEKTVAPLKDQYLIKRIFGAPRMNLSNGAEKGKSGVWSLMHPEGGVYRLGANAIFGSSINVG